jgi:AcrR family transcriptional regulator
VTTAFDPLPRGRHKLTAEEVLASQRERLLQAMLVCVGEHGYAATTVPQVVATARVSRNGFYAAFADKLDCFLALCDQLAAELLESLYALGGAPDALERGMGVYLRWWADRPAFARSYLVELPTAGARAVEQRDARLRDFEALLAALAPGGPDPLAITVLARGITEVVGLEVREGRIAALPALQDRLVALARAVLGAPASSRLS